MITLYKKNFCFYESVSEWKKNYHVVLDAYIAWRSNWGEMMWSKTLLKQNKKFKRRWGCNSHLFFTLLLIKERVVRARVLFFCAAWKKIGKAEFFSLQLLDQQKRKKKLCRVHVETVNGVLGFVLRKHKFNPDRQKVKWLDLPISKVVLHTLL